MLEQIIEVIRECEDFKGRGESRYHEEQAEISAYRKIKEICGVKNESEGKGY